MLWLSLFHFFPPHLTHLNSRSALSLKRYFSLSLMEHILFIAHIHLCTGDSCLQTWLSQSCRLWSHMLLPSSTPHAIILVIPQPTFFSFLGADLSLFSFKDYDVFSSLSVLYTDCCIWPCKWSTKGLSQSFPLNWPRNHSFHMGLLFESKKCAHRFDPVSQKCPLQSSILRIVQPSHRNSSKTSHNVKP